MPSYRDLKVWQKSFDLTLAIYQVASQLPKNENFGLVSQIQRCSVSIPSNIAEGQQRNSKKEFLQFISIARGSAAELSTQLLIIEEVYGISTTKLVQCVEELQKMLYALQSKL